jgi:orotidine-5'-phosphate decarboxylase
VTPRLWVALDFSERSAVERLLAEIPEHRYVKVGLELYCALGPAYVEELAARGYHVFLDLKCHDIPRTVGRAVLSVRRLGAELLTVHAAGGLEMLQAACQSAGAMELVAVTVLTSLDQTALQEVGIGSTVAALSEAQARLAARAGLAGLVCSGQEASRLRHLWPHARLVVPGIRRAGDDRGDQRRVNTPQSALRAGATDLVVGRPVVEAEHPAAVLQSLLQQMDGWGGDGEP